MATQRPQPPRLAGAFMYEQTTIPEGLTIAQWRARKQAQRACERRRGIIQRIRAPRAGR